MSLNIYDDDLFHDTLLIVSEEEYPDWGLFINHYRRGYARQIGESMRLVNPDPLFWDYLQDKEQENEVCKEYDPRRLEKQLRYFLSKQDFRLIQYRYLMNLTLKEVADYIGMSLQKIMEAIERILKYLRNRLKYQFVL